MYLKLVFLQLIACICYQALACGPNTTTLIGTNSSWRYNDSGNNLNTSWRNSGYNDSSWSTGNAELGYGSNNETTTISYGSNSNNKHRTYYFRKSFNIANLNDVANGAELGILRDDGAVVYLNGTEIYRTNMPSGNITFNTLASSAVGGAEESQYFNTTVPASNFVQGTNVIAVEIHQRAVTSSDLGFNFELCGLVGNGGGNLPNILRGPYLQKSTTSSVVVKWRTDAAASSKVFYGSSVGNLSQSIENTNLATDHELEITGLSPNTIYYYAVGTTGGEIVGNDADHYFKTNPTIGAQGNYRMWVLGDAGTATNNQRNVRTAFQNYNGSNHTDMILMLGDNAYNSGTDTEYQNAVFQNMYEDLLITSVLWSCPGNHEYYGGADGPTQTGTYYDIFTFPKNGESGGLASNTEAYYSFDYGNVHVVSMDSHDSDRTQGGPMITWLANDLAQTTQEWIVVIFHHPPYSKGSHNSDTEAQLIQMRQNALPIMEQHGVDLVLSGHSHSYERSKLIRGHYGLSTSFDECTMLVDGGSGKPDVDSAYLKVTESTLAGDGSIYITAGSSGKISGGSLNHPVMYSSLNQLGSVVVDVIGDSLAVKFLNDSGNVSDYFSIVKKSLGANYDTDGDSYSDNLECPSGFPCVDTDGDCIPDFKDLDSDDDGVPDAIDACVLQVGNAANYGCPGTNSPPVANADNFNTSVNTPVGGDLSANDTEPDGDMLVLTTTPVTPPSNGIINLNSNGGFGYTPDFGFVGTDSFEYEICDDAPAPLCDNAIVTIVVSSSNNPPVANNDSFTTTVGNPVSGDVSTNDTDPDGDNLTVNTTPIVAPPGGTVVLNSNGTFTYTPNSNTVGSDSFSYEICDDGIPNFCDIAVVSFTINSTNNPPNVVDDFYTTTENTNISGNVLANDSDPDGNALIAISTPVTPPSNGSLSFNSSGAFTYDPDPGFIGVDSFVYLVCDNGAPPFCLQGTVTITVVSSNNVPLAVNDGVTTFESTSVSDNVLTNDSDIDGDNLTATTPLISTTSNGTTTFSSNGDYTYTPNAGFLGTDSFVYEVCDDGNPILCDQAIVTITVANQNTQPVAVDDINSTIENTAVSANLLANDTDVNGDNLIATTTPILPPANGSVTLISNGAYTYTPNPGFLGTDSFVYEVCDDGIPSLCDIGLVTINVTVSNNAPIAVDDFGNGTLDTPEVGSVVGNDSDPDGDNLLVTTTSITPPTNGSVSLTTNGVYIYTPNSGFLGTDSFEYEVCDDGNPVLCDTAVVTITIIAINNPPIAVDDIGNGTLDTPVNGDVVVNDSDPNGDNLSVTTTPTIAPSNGSVVLSANGTYIYTPTTGYSGTDSFEYEVCDDGSPILCDAAIVTLTITIVNNAPIAVDDIGNGNMDTPVNGDVVANDSDPDGDNLFVTTTPITAPSNGSVTLNINGTYTYTPTTGYSGTDSFEYEVCDDGSPILCDTAIVTLTIVAVNNAPIAVDDAGNGIMDTPVNGDLVGNDSDPDGDNLLVETIPVIAPGNGSVILNTNGTYTYTPNTGFTGTDSFIYEVCDDGIPVLCDIGVVTMTVAAGNSAPIAVNDSYSGLANSVVSDNVLLNDSDPEGDNLILSTSAVSTPANGVVSLNSNGTFTYTPFSNFDGTDSFEYEVCDDGSPVLCDQATVFLTIIGNSAPVAVDDSGSSSLNTPVVGDVEANDSDPDGNNLSVTTTPVLAPTNGTVTLNSNGMYTYTPNSGFSGSDSFEYEICDDGSPVLCDSAIVSITIAAGTNNPPVAVNDNFTTIVNVPLGGSVLNNDSDPNGDNISLTTTAVVPPANGSVFLFNNGGISYTPNNNYTGADSFVYEICDDGSPILCSQATVFITISSGANNAPMAMDDSGTTAFNTAFSSNALTNDSDPDGDPIAASTTLVSSPSNGTATIATNGDYTYTPNSGFQGTDSFEYEVCDNKAPPLCDTAVVTITVNAPGNNPPVAVNDTVSTPENVTINFLVLTNDSDPDGDNLFATTTPIVSPANGTVSIFATGVVSYVPNTGFSGVDSFVYEVCDNGSPILCDLATVIVTVIPDVNLPPVAVDDFRQTSYNVGFSMSAFTNDSDPNGDNLIMTTTTVIPPSFGNVILNANGIFTYTPNSGYVGQDSFMYEVCDDGSPVLCDSAIVTITMTTANNYPIAVDDTYSTTYDIPVAANVLDNDSDPDGHNLLVTFIPVSGPNNGSLILNANGTFTYTANTGFVGVDTFEYEVCDNGGPSLCDQAIVTITVTSPPNTPPAAVNDYFTTIENTATSGDLLLNDSDPEGDNLVINVTPVAGVSFGTLVINPDGTFNYTPNTGFVGMDTFEYEVCDDGIPSLCSTAIATIIVNNPPNTTPDAINDSYTILVNSTLNDNVVTNDVDPEGDNLIVTTPPLLNVSSGTLVLNSDGSFVYTPNTGFIGTDMFAYELCDDGVPVLCDLATVTITVNTQPNTAPVAVDDTFTTPYETVLTDNVLTNDSDPNGDNLTATTTPTANVSNGTLTLNANGDFTYTPNTGFSGSDSFEYEVCDDGTPVLCDSAVVVITVEAATNLAPIATSDSYSTPYETVLNGNVASNDSDPNGDNLTVTTTPVSNVTNGTLILNANGDFSYTPNSGYSGSDSFVYEICDDGSPVLCEIATVLIFVNLQANQGPIAVADVFTTSFETPLTANVTANDSDPNGDNLIVNTIPVINVTNGTVTLNTNGDFTYTPNTGFSGTDSFVYEVCDDGIPVLCDFASVTITVNPIPNTPPIAVDDSFNGMQYLPLTGDVIPNDSDPDGDNLIVTTTPIVNVVNGTLTLNNDGTFTYTPNPGFFGTDSFEYEVCDDGTPLVECDQAVVNLTIQQTGDCVVANDDNFTTPFETSLSGSPLTNDLGDSITITTTPVVDVASGTLTINPDSTFIYVPDTGFYGTDSFSYEVCEILQTSCMFTCDTATVIIAVDPPINNPPVAIDDNVTGTANSSIMDNVVTNDTDPEGHTLTVNTTPIVDVSNGVLTLNSDGTFTYNPNSGFIGTDSFVYEVCDNGIPIYCDQAVVTIVVNPDTNLPPVAMDDTKSTSYNVGFFQDVLLNDTDPNGDSLILTTTPIINVTFGTLVLNSNGFYTYTPQSGYVGTDSFVYEVCDNRTPPLCDTATVVITMTTDNNPPVAIDDNYTTPILTPVSDDVSSNDSDPDGDLLTVTTTPITAPTLGTLVLNPDGTFTYTPTITINGIDSFEYEICDNGGPNLCDTAVVIITIGTGNNPPDAVTDSLSTIMDIPVSGNVLDNDSDLENDNLLVTTTPLSGPSNGTLILNADGTFDYTPNTGFVGVDQFVYEVCDDGVPVLCSISTVVITVNTPPNEAPMAVDDSYNVLEDNLLFGTLVVNDSDPNGDSIFITTIPVIDVSNGTLVISPNGEFDYTPNPDFVGADSFQYEICDNGIPVLCDTALVLINVQGLNDAPVTVSDTISTMENTMVNILILNNDADIDGNLDPASVTLVTTPPAAQGTVSVNPDGSLTFTPAANFVGPVDVFYYQVCDDGTPAPPKCALGAVVVTVVEENDPPVAEIDIYSTPEDTALNGDLLGNDSDPNGDNITINTTPVIPPNNGTLVINSDGTFDYTPNNNFNGFDSFEYVICDDGSPILCDSALVEITVTPVNDAPIAQNDTHSGLEDNVLMGDVSPNDIEIDAEVLTYNTTPISGPSNGTLILNADGTYTYTPNPDFNGADQFVYEVCDPGMPMLCDQATVTLIIAPVNDALIAVNDTITIPPGLPSNVPVLDNDSDLDGNIDPTSVVLIGVPPATQGTVTVNPDGSLTFVPATGFAGTVDPFDYQVCDDGTPMPGLCDTATVYIIVESINNNPIAIDDNYTTNEDIPLIDNVTANDSDPDGDNITVSTTPVTPPTNGSLVLNSNGIFNYFPNQNYSGTDSFEYELCDDGIPVLCDTAVVYITILPINDPPIPQGDSNTTDEDTPVSGDVTINDIEPDGENLVVDTIPYILPANGTVVINSDGSYTYTPNQDYNGIDVFAYQVCDDSPQVLCETSTVTIIINPVNDPPIVVEDSVTTLEDLPILIDILANDSDIDGNLNPATITIFTIPPTTEGTLVLNPDGTLLFTPAPGFVGNVTPIVYFVCDDGSPAPPECNFGTIYIEVIASNRAPVANLDNYTGDEDTPVVGNVLDNDSDPNPADILTVTTTPVVTPINGSVILNADGSFTYTPDAGFIGQDSFEYEVCDNGNPVLCTTAVVTINIVVCPIVSFNQPTICEGEAVLMIADDAGFGATYSWDFGTTATPQFSTSRFQQVTFSTAGAIDVMLTVSMNGCSRVVTNTVSIESEPVADGGADVYLCNGDTATLGGIMTGPAGSTYYWTPIDGMLSTNDVANPLVAPNQTTTYSVFVTVGSCTSVDEVTVFVLDRPNARAGFDDFICFGDSIMIGDPFGPRPGATYSWSPTTGLSDPNVCNPLVSPAVATTYTVTMTENGCSDTDDILIEVAPAPNATAGPGQAICDDNPTGVVLGGAGNDPFAIYVWTPNLYLDNQNSPNPVATPPSTLTYTMTAIRFGCSVEEQVTVTVGECLYPPVAVNDTLTMTEDGTLSSNIMSNDYSPNGFNLAINPTLITLPTNGAAMVTSSGGLTYTPNQNYYGVDSFLYELCDDNSPVLCDTGLVVINITSINDGPITQPDQFTTPIDVVVMGDVLLNDTDPEGDSLFLNMGSLVLPNNGILMMNPDGSFEYTPDSQFEGTDVFYYEVCDNGVPSICETEQVTILVGNCMDVELSVFLEGPFDVNTQEMATTLGAVRKILPGQTPTNTLVSPTPPGQPYNNPPWNYPGTEGLTFTDADYSADVVDWVLVSLRTAPEKSKEVWMTAGLVLKDGRIEFVEPCFPDLSAGGPYYIVIEHRNHMGIMSEDPIPVINRKMVYDFRVNNTFRDLTSFGQVQILPGVYAMYAADGDQVADVISYDITGLDKILWTAENGIFDKYRAGDFNMDGDVNGVDKILWDQNNGLSSRVPK